MVPKSLLLPGVGGTPTAMSIGTGLAPVGGSHGSFSPLVVGVVTKGTCWMPLVFNLGELCPGTDGSNGDSTEGKGTTGWDDEGCGTVGGAFGGSGTVGEAVGGSGTMGWAVGGSGTVRGAVGGSGTVGGAVGANGTVGMDTGGLTLF